MRRSGTGAFGIEALSRGAAHVVFIERDSRAVALIERNVAQCGLRERCTVRRATLPAALDDAVARAGSGHLRRQSGCRRSR